MVKTKTGHYALLSEEDIHFIFRERGNGKTQQWIADRLGVSQVSVSNVLNGKTHRHISHV